MLQRASCEKGYKGRRIFPNGAGEGEMPNLAEPGASISVILLRLAVEAGAMFDEKFWMKSRDIAVVK